MNRADFLRDPMVADFAAWLGNTLPTLRIDLNLKQSRFVPTPVRMTAVGIDQVLSGYVWRSVGMRTGDWHETRSRLAALSGALTTAVKAADNTAALAACQAILAWGGNRNANVGAAPFLQALADNGTLCLYLRHTTGAFALASADIRQVCPPVESLNAMLTKVHALCASDGLPIYDSRVAAATAALVELWREQTGRSGAPLPAALAFPATERSRTVRHLFPNARTPGVIPRQAPTTCAQWASAKVRLGWLMAHVLTQYPEMLSTCCHTPSLADRMHAFEASLFMIGYDVQCLANASGV